MVLSWFRRPSRPARRPARFSPRVEGLEERTVPAATDLSITKAVSGGLFVPGHTVTYTLTVLNNGPATTGTGVTVTDTLPSSLTLTSATVTSGTGTVTTSGSTVTGTLNNLAAGASTVITIQATLSTTATGSVTNTATVTPASGDTDTNTSNNTATATFSVSSTTPSQNQCFVAQVYEDLLHRAPDQQGLAYWTNLLDSGRLTRQQVALDIEQSPEYRIDLVQRLYQQYLHRAADPTGLNTFTNFLANGGTDQQLAAILAGSQEFFTTQGGGTNAGFLTALYQDALGRSISASELQAWEQQLANGMTRDQVARFIINSQEATTFTVRNYYQQLLGRQADQQGLNSFVQAIQNENGTTGTNTNASNTNTSASNANASGGNTSASGGRGQTNEQVQAIIIGSQEFFSRLTC